MSDDLTLTVGGRSISGWTSVRVTSGIERCTRDFEIGLTELFPGELDAVVAQPGESCEVKIGSDLVITGYIDKFIPSISPGQHSIIVTGRGKCQDMVDCAAEWPGQQVVNSSVLDIAQKLGKPYGIEVSGLDSQKLPQFNILYGETSWEVIERICRYSGLLAYELADGSLYLANVGDKIAASGFTEGQNVQHASIQYSMDQRFSEYRVYAMALDTLRDIGEGGNVIESVTDAAVTRRRMRVIISEQGDIGLTVSKLRATWEMNRRAGRSQVVRIETDSWRDSAGVLWEPNTLVDISLPKLKMPQATWIIGEVTYKRDAKGTTAVLTIMAPGAFNPQPILLFPLLRDLELPVDKPPVQG